MQIDAHANSHVKVEVIVRDAKCQVVFAFRLNSLPTFKRVCLFSHGRVAKKRYRVVEWSLGSAASFKISRILEFGTGEAHLP